MSILMKLKIIPDTVSTCFKSEREEVQLQPIRPKVQSRIEPVEREVVYKKATTAYVQKLTKEKQALKRLHKKVHHHKQHTEEDKPKEEEYDFSWTTTLNPFDRKNPFNPINAFDLKNPASVLNAPFNPMVQMLNPYRNNDD